MSLLSSAVCFIKSTCVCCQFMVVATDIKFAWSVLQKKNEFWKHMWKKKLRQDGGEGLSGNARHISSCTSGQKSNLKAYIKMNPFCFYGGSNRLDTTTEGKNWNCFAVDRLAPGIPGFSARKILSYMVSNRVYRWWTCDILSKLALKNQ